MRSLKPLLLASTAVLVFAPGALAQTTQAPATIAQGQQAGDAAARDQANQVQEVVVTGSRIARPNLDQPTPISTLSPQQIQNTGTANLGDIITRLPSAGFNGTARSNSNNFGNSSGLSQIDLRNLGVSRTLVLVDGQRHVAGDITNNAVDVNSIPTALVDRVEIITGGASAIYGSDAVSGVVNIILKKNFEGMEIQAQGGGYDNGFGADYSTYGTFGKNFLDGKLNVNVTGYWTKEAGIEAKNIPTAHNYGTIVNDADIDPATFDPTYYNSTTPIRRNGIPDRLYVQNVGSEYLSRTGVLLDGSTFLPSLSFNAAGQIIPVPARSGYNSFAFAQLPANCGVSCYFTEDYEQLQSPLETKGFDFRASYDATSHLHFTLDGKYAVSDVTNLVQPSYTFGDYQLQPDNAFITPEIRSALGGLDAADYPYISRFLNAGRNQEITRRTFRIVAGVSGDFDAKITQVKWDGALNYGQTDTRIRSQQLQLVNNFAAALDSVIDPATGQPACRINVPSALGNGTPYTFNGTLNRAVDETATTIAQSACVPYNPFGIQNNDAALGYSFGDFTTRDKLSQQVANLNATFDTSRFFNLQGGPLAFAVGGEYRMERTSEVNDALLIANATENLAANSAGGYNVYEGYIEASAPVFKHFAPGLDELSFDAAFRASKYSTVGSTDAYKFSMVYGPFRDIKFRGTYSRAIRAPNITEAFLPASGGFFNVTDPCDASNIGGSTNYAANCKAAGVPADFTSNSNSSIVGTTQGNPNLDPEKSISYTGGIILQPHWVPRLSITLDYFSIKIKNAITNVQAQDIINNCYNGASLDPQYCSLFTRGTDSNINFVRTTYVNASKLTTDGIDLNADYSIGVSGLTDRFAFTRGIDGRLAFNLNATYLIHLRNFPFQNIPDQVQINEGTGTQPKLRALTGLTYQQGGLSVNWQVRYLGRTANFSRDATAVDKAESTDIPFNKQEFLHDLTVRYDLPGSRFRGAQIYAGVNNLTDEQPPGYLLGTLNDLGYDLGRKIYAGVKIRR